MNTTALISKLEKTKLLIDECLNSLQEGVPPLAGQTRLLLEHNLPSGIDFTTPARPFMKNFVGLAGAKKFALLVAWMAKGDLEKQIGLWEIESLWDSMSGMLKVRFNRKFTSDAKDSDWVESRKTGFYNLRPNWTEALDGKQGDQP